MTHHDKRNGPEAQSAHDAFDRILAEANQSISAPSRLKKNVSRAIGRSIAIRRVGAVSSVAMIVLIASVIVQTLPGPTSQVQPGGQRADLDHVVSPSPDEIMSNVPAVHRTAVVYSEPDSKYFARAFPTSKPNVTIVRLYRDLTPTREPALDNAGEDTRDEKPENIDQSTDSPGAAEPGSESNETIIRSEA